MPVVRYHHIEAPKINGTQVEVHFRACYAHSPLRNWRMQRWFDDHADVCMKNKTQMGFAVPTASVNVVYQMCHLFSHYFDEGIGLRQLMDYYFALRVWHNDVMECKDLQTQGMWSEGLGTPVMSATEIMAVLRSFGMAKFTSAVICLKHHDLVPPCHCYIQPIRRWNAPYVNVTTLPPIPQFLRIIQAIPLSFKNASRKPVMLISPRQLRTLLI